METDELQRWKTPEKNIIIDTAENTEVLFGLCSKKMHVS